MVLLLYLCIYFMVKLVKYFGVVFSLFVGLFLIMTNSVFASSDIASLPVNLGVADITSVLYIVAFIGGALMILTPCSAATVPAYFANTFGENASGSKSKITQRTAVFFLGFSLVYAFMGGGASLIGRWLNLYQEQLAIVSGVLLIVFGVLVFIGKSFFSFSSMKPNRQASTKGTFAFGSVFAIGFSGCAGPILAGILTIASGLPTVQAVLLMFFYSLGMGLPLLLLSLVFDRYNILNLGFFKWNREIKIAKKSLFLTLPNIISGILLFALGVVFILFQSTGALSATFPRAITDIGYGLQDWLLAIDMPPYVDVIAFVVVGFVLIKFISEKMSDNEEIHFRLNIDKDRARLALIFIAVILFSFNQILFFTKQSEAKKKLEQAIEASRPANLDIIVISADECVECFDINKPIGVLKSQNVNIISERVVDWKSEEGSELIEKTGIKYVPNLVISGEINKIKEVKDLLSQAGNVGDSDYFMSVVPLPYVDVESGEVSGVFQVTYLADESCSECYDISAHEVALNNLGMVVSNKRTVDVSSEEGKDMVLRYDITYVPTLLLTGDLDEYSALEQVWPQVGTVEDDGVFVFRKTEIMGAYKDLKTGEVISAESQDTSS